jgi:hypothetical protein
VFADFARIKKIKCRKSFFTANKTKKKGIKNYVEIRFFRPELVLDSNSCSFELAQKIEKFQPFSVTQPLTFYFYFFILTVIFFFVKVGFKLAYAYLNLFYKF